MSLSANSDGYPDLNADFNDHTRPDWIQFDISEARQG